METIYKMIGEQGNLVAFFFVYTRGEFRLIQFFVSLLLYFVIFFGIAFILNMLLRTTWLMAFLYPIVISIIVSNIKLRDYFIHTKEAFTEVYETMTSLAAVDLTILCLGYVGMIVSGIDIKELTIVRASCWV